MTAKEKDDKQLFKGKYHYAAGKRKSAIAKVRLYEQGKGVIYINDREIDEYFPTTAVRLIALQPLSHVEDDKKKKIGISVKIAGGGFASQAEAIRHGLAKALVVMDSNLKPVLKKYGFMTRDSRVKERKKPGLKKARRAPQWQKR